MTRIAFLTHTNAPGGAEQSLRRYVELSRHQSDIKIVTLAAGDRGVWAPLPAQNVIAPPEDLRFPAQLRWLRQTLKELNPKIVVSNTMRIGPYGVLTRPRSAEHVYWLHDGVGKESAMGRLANLITKRMVFPDVSRFIVNSEWTDGTLKDTYPKAESLVAYPLCNLSGRGGVRNLQDSVRLLYLGRISPWKAPHLAVQALQTLEEQFSGRYQLTIAGASHFGEDDYSHELLATIARSGLEGRVTFTGHIDGVAQVLADHDLLLHCSNRPEPFGRVIVEGLSTGLPVLASNIGAPVDLIQSGENGYLYTSNDSEALASAVARATESADHYRTLSVGALRSSEKYAESPIVASIDNFLGEEPS